MKIYIINGPNLNMLGIREPQKYGRATYEELCDTVKAHCDSAGITPVFYQSNHEGDLVDKIQEAYFSGADGIVINPGAYTHTSIAILDAVLSTALPCVEVHITNPDEREDFRRISYIRNAAFKTVCGKGIMGYIEACDAIVELLGAKK
jgi:3-dehydroquinate dehydratase-2